MLKWLNFLTLLGILVALVLLVTPGCRAGDWFGGLFDRGHHQERGTAYETRRGMHYEYRGHVSPSVCGSCGCNHGVCNHCYGYTCQQQITCYQQYCRREQVNVNVNENRNVNVTEHHEFVHVPPHTQGPVMSLWANLLGIFQLDARASTFTHVPRPRGYRSGYQPRSSYGKTYYFSRRPYYGNSGGCGVFQSWTPSVRGGYRVRHHYGVGRTHYPSPRRSSSGLHLHAGPSRVSPQPSPSRSSSSLHLSAGPSRHSGSGGLSIGASASRHGGGSRHSGGLSLRAGPSRHGH